MRVSATIDQATLVNLIEAGAIHGTHVVGQSDGWEVVVKYGRIQKSLAAKRGEVRIFRKLDTLDRFLRGIGLVQYQVDARQFNQEAFKAARTNAAAAERLKNAHAAAAYRTWLEDKVNASRTGLADGSNKVLTAKEWADIRAAKRKQGAGLAA